MRTAYDLRNKEKRMKRKFWPAAMTAIMALLLAFGFAACADTGDTGNDNPNDNPDTPRSPYRRRRDWYSRSVRMGRSTS